MVVPRPNKEVLEGVGSQIPSGTQARNDGILDDEFDLQQLLVGLKTVCERIGSIDAITGGDHRRASEMGDAIAKALEGPEKISPEEALLRCIQKVYTKNMKSRTQDMMQKFIIDLMAPKKLTIAPKEFAEKREAIAVKQRENEMRFWSKYHVDVKKAESPHEILLTKQWPKWKTKMRGWVEKYKKEERPIRGLKQPGDPSEKKKGRGFERQASAGNVAGPGGFGNIDMDAMRGMGGAQDMDNDSDDSNASDSVKPCRDPDTLLRAFGLPDSNSKPVNERDDVSSMVEQKILLSGQKLMLDDDNDPEAMQRKKEANAHYRRFHKMQEENYLQRIADTVNSKPGKRLQHLTALNVANLSVSTYFRTCDSLGLVPKIPKSVVNDAHNDEEGMLASVLDLEGLQMADEDLESWNQALFTETSVLADRTSRRPDLKKPESVLTLLPACKVRILRLGHNRFSDKSVSRFLGGFLRQKKRVFDLEEISLDGLNLLSQMSINKLSTILGSSAIFPKLTSLNLNGISTLFTQRDLAQVFCDNIVKMGTLTELKLGDTGLGLVSQYTVSMFAEALSEMRIKKLDMSQNFIQKDGFIALGKVFEEIKLDELSIDYNSDRPVKGDHSTAADDSPITYLLEKLNFQTQLYSLSLRQSGLCYQTDLVLCESLDTLTKLTHLDVSDNAHGKDGLRCIMRLLMSKSCGLSAVNVQTIREKYYSNSEKFRFNFSDPCGIYDVILDRPVGRTTMKFLYKWAEFFKMKDTCMEICTLDNVNFNGFPCTTKQNSEGVPSYEFNPAKGRMRFKYTINVNQLPKPPPGHDETKDFDLISPKKNSEINPMAIKSVSEFSKLKATLLRFVPIATMFDSLTSEEERKIMIEALSYDMQLKLCHIKYFIEKAPLLTQFIVRTLYATVNRTDAMHLVNMLPHPSLQKAVRAVTSNAFFFNSENPTARYVLQVDNPTDRNLAESIFTINSWEKQISIEGEVLDLSQYGDWSCMRNIVLNGRCVRTDDFFAKFPFVTSGTLEFDYRTRMFTEEGTPSRTHRLIWDEIMGKMLEAPVTQLSKLRTFRQISHLLTLNLAYFRDLLGCFQKCPKDMDWWSNDTRNLDECDPNSLTPVVGSLFLDSDGQTFIRADVFIMAWSRCREENWMVMSNNRSERLVKDRDPDGILYDSTLFCKAEQKVVTSALGSAICFDVRRMCDPWSNFGGWYNCNLGIQEEWVIARILISMAAIEDGENMLEPNWTGARAGITGIFHVPITWLTELPRFGTFSALYVSERNDYIELEAREELGEKYLGHGEYEKVLKLQLDPDTGKKKKPPLKD